MKKILIAITGAVLALTSNSNSAFAQAQDAAQPDQKPSKWDASAALGLTLTRGNSKTLLGTANVLATKKAGRNEYNLGADGTYGESDGVKNAESARAFGQYNRLLSERAFGYARLELMHDDIAGVKWRGIFSPGAGYYFVKNPTTTLRGELGPAFIYDRMIRNGEYDEKGYMTLRIAERFDHKLNDRVKIWQMVEILPQVDDFENYIINAEIGIDAALTTHLSLRTYLQDTYHSQPASGRQKNDLKLVTAIAYKF